jgi:hypothetical protein
VDLWKVSAQNPAPVRLALATKKVQLHHGDVDVGRTFGTPILKLGVSCRAAISKENVIRTEVCMEAADGGLAAVAVSIGTVRAGAVNYLSPPLVEQFPAELCECRH